MCRGLTPSQSAELENIGGHVDVKNFDEGEVHVNGLQAHPAKGSQEEVVQGGGNSHTEAVHPPRGQPGVDQKHQVQAQQGQGQVDQDLRRVVSAKLADQKNGIIGRK